MIKFTGFVLIFLGSIGMGIYLVRKTKTSLKYTKAMLDIMRHIKHRIEYFNAPLDEIYSTFPSDDISVSSFLKKAEKEGWLKAVESSETMNLDEKTVRIITEFGDKLGKTNKDDQIVLCDFYIRKMEELYEEMQKSIPQKNRTTLALCIYGGMLIIIFFI